MHEAEPLERFDRALAAFFARWTLGLLFLMPGWHKVFQMGPLEHARRLFVEGYADSWIPVWLLWILGAVIPLVELGAGLLLCAGVGVRIALVALSADLLIVTYGHLLAEPFFNITSHILPRVALVLVLLMMPERWDRWTASALLAGRRRPATEQLRE